MGYGFCLPANPAERLQLQLGLGIEGGAGVGEKEEEEEEEEEDEWEECEDSASVRKKLLTQRGLSLRHGLSLKDPLPTGLMQAARLCLASEREAYEMGVEKKVGRLSGREWVSESLRGSDRRVWCLVFRRPHFSPFYLFLLPVVLFLSFSFLSFSLFLFLCIYLCLFLTLSTYL